MIEYKGYRGKVEFDAEAGLLHGEVLGIRDVVTFQGTSVEEVEQSFRESVDDYLAFCAERGEEPDRAYSGRFVVRVDSDLHRQLNLAAQASGVSLNNWVAERLKEAVIEPVPRRTAGKRRNVIAVAKRRTKSRRQSGK